MSTQPFVSNIPGQVTAVIAPAPTVALYVPFQIGADGRLALTSDPVRQVAQQLIDIALTAPGDRVMRSNYGAGVSRLTFEDASMPQFQAVAQKLQITFSSNPVNGVSNINVSILETPQGEYLFQVSFSLDQDPQVHQALFDYAGNLVGNT